MRKKHDQYHPCVEWMEREQDYVHGERRLWCGVIMRAWDDAHGINVPDRRDGSKEFFIDQARAWLTGNSRNFRAVCSYANVDAQRLRKEAIKRFRNQHQKEHDYA